MAGPLTITLLHPFKTARPRAVNAEAEAIHSPQMVMHGLIGGYGEEDGVGAAVAGGAPGCRGITGAGATAMAPSSAADEATDEGVVVIRAPVIRPQWAMKSRRPAATGRRTVVDGRRRARMRGRPQTGGGAWGWRANGRGRRCADAGTKALDTK